MKKVYIHRENIVDTNTFCDHGLNIFGNKKCDEDWEELEDQLRESKGILNKKRSQRMSVNNSWVRNAHQYRTKAAGAIHQKTFDQVIAVCSEAYHVRVPVPEKQKPIEPPVHLNYVYAYSLRKKYTKEKTSSLYRRKSRKVTDSNLPKRKSVKASTRTESRRQRIRQKQQLKESASVEGARFAWPPGIAEQPYKNQLSWGAAADLAKETVRNKNTTFSGHQNYGFRDTSLSFEEDFESENVPIAQSCKNSIAAIDKIYSQLFEQE